MMEEIEEARAHAEKAGGNHPAEETKNGWLLKMKVLTIWQSVITNKYMVSRPNIWYAYTA